MSKFTKFLLFTVALLNAAGAAAMDEKAFDNAFRALPNEPASKRLQALQDLRYRWLMESFPARATYQGYPGVNDRWTDASEAGIQRRQEQTRRMLAAVRHIHSEQLSADQQLDYQLLYQDLLNEVKGFQFPEHLLPINHMSGIQRSVPGVLNAMPRRTADDYEIILTRLEKLPTLVQQTQALMREGLKQKITPPQITLRDLPAQIRALMPEDPQQSPLLSAFSEMPQSIPASRQRRLRERAYALYNKALVPAWRNLAEFVEREYIPSARVNTAFTSLPDGLRWYAYKVRTSTTTALSPEEIHRIGLNEVRRIRAEMEKIIKKTGFEGDFREFTEFLRTDPQFFYTDKEALIRGYRDIAKRIDGELPKLFGMLPRLPYGVKPIPAYAEKVQTTAYYQPGSPEAGRAGIFFANTYKLDSRPKWEMEALTVHEAVPGHHLQIALAQEQKDIHPLRRTQFYTAFVEGWGLYSESLGHDLGLYQDPYSEFGALTYDMWRAVRLVVDTGMHQLGWSREEAIEYFMENSAKPLHDVTVEIDRYLVWPGQALAYKLGQLKIRELRANAEQQLGDNFDIRAFHDQLLSTGALPLNVLETRMNDWIKAQSSNSVSTRAKPTPAGQATSS
ncbi:DUF885 domain-containing protein [Microbulbifer thermotolerans]|uniref:DUF885 domain-containing protein n=1 Tax=Microbulbifer thermotolerans TaxID=252514 RepID=UPI0022490B21|nr:DUF885 domain-containing protein [Microbulbifer thermotolerans]MCX2831594.1 DUF885 domain-containing protein [Microbulbifer thermotolerans]MCX2835008.1 DUF885 domain-containing protein [Microbulbifer thermotolerans]